MKRDELAEAARPEVVVESVARRRSELQEGDHDHGGPVESVRKASYRGHEITIRTTYSIEVDGVPIEGHFGVRDDGQVHYHAVPNVSFASAIDVVKQLIDTFPGDFEEDATDHSHGGNPHQGHS